LERWCVSMPDHIVLVGMLESYSTPRTPGTVIWGANATFKVQPDVDRLYIMDGVQGDQRFHDDTMLALNKLPANVRILSLRKEPEIPRCEVLDTDALVAYFGGLRYFGCTPAYMLADAIRHKPKRISVCGMYHPTDSTEYAPYIQCMNMWAGIAIGRGIELDIAANCGLCRSAPWQASMYGYARNEREAEAMRIANDAYCRCLRLPRKWMRTQELLDSGVDMQGLPEAGPDIFTEDVA